MGQVRVCKYANAWQLAKHGSDKTKCFEQLILRKENQSRQNGKKGSRFPGRRSK